MATLFCPGEYQSVKFVRVKNVYLAGLHRAIFFVTLVYVIGFQLVLDHGYQATDSFSGTPNIKVKGVARTLENGKVYDAVDLIHPALEESAVFIQTDFVETNGQVRATCSGVDRAGTAPAQVTEVCDCGNDPIKCEDGFCIPDMPTANGYTTGKCINTNLTEDGDDDESESRVMITKGGMGWMCEVRAWCPVEDEKAGHRNKLPQVANFTIFARIDGMFPNLAPNQTFSNYQKNKLVWNQNLFYLSDLVAAAMTQEELERVPLENGSQPRRLPEKYFHSIVGKGAEIVINYIWDCNLDHDDDCTTQLKINRIDEGNGFNFRSSKQYFDPAEPDVVKRDLVKLYGLRIVFRVVGKGGKFNAVQLGVVLGSGLGLLGIATVVADLLLYTNKRLNVYMTAKYEEVQDRTTSGEENEFHLLEDETEVEGEQIGQSLQNAA